MKALAMPPASSPTIAGRYGMTQAGENAPLRTANAKLSVTRLISRFSGTAERASKPMPYIKTGSRNSPPPNPISPPRPPIGTHHPKARRKYGQAMARIMSHSASDAPCPALCRASTSFLPQFGVLQDVDDRDKPGQPDSPL